MPVTAIWGVGQRTEEALRRLGLTTVRDVAQAPIGMLRAALGPSAAQHLHELSWGRDNRAVTPERIEKSLGAETTFDLDITDFATVRKCLLQLSDRIAVRARAAGKLGRTITVKVRFADFRTLNRSRTLPAATDVAQETFTTAMALLESVWRGEPLRLVGVRLEGLTSSAAPVQLSLGGQDDNWREAELVKDAITARYGHGLIGRASLLGGQPNRTSGDERD